MALAITDLKILVGNDTNPEVGWKKYQTNLNEDAGGADLFMAYYRDPNRQSKENWITEIQLYRGPGAVDTHWQKDGTNLNLDSGGDELYLIYKRGGPLRPIVGIEIVRNVKEVPPGYEVIAQDLNAHAGGADLFIAFLRKNRTLSFGEMTCVSPSSGYGGLAKAVVNTSLSAAGAAVGAVGGFVIGSATGPGAAIIVIGAGAAGAAAGTAIAEAINAVADDVGKGTKDDVCIRLSGTKVWPYNKDGRHEMGSGDKVDVDFVAPFQDVLRVSIMEKDWLLWTIDTEKVMDLLGESVFTPKASDTGTYMFYNADEGSTYSLEIFIDSTSPQLKVTNKGDKELDVFEETNKVATLKPNESKLMPTMAGEFWKFQVKGTNTVVATYRATDKPDQIYVIPEPKLTITNGTKERIQIYDQLHKQDTISLEAAATHELVTFPGQVWSFIGESNRLQTCIATEEVAQSAVITMPYLQVRNDASAPIEITGFRVREPLTVQPGTVTDFLPTMAGEIWTLHLANDRVEKYIATNVTEQLITITQNKLVFPPESPTN